MFEVTIVSIPRVLQSPQSLGVILTPEINSESLEKYVATHLPTNQTYMVPCKEKNNLDGTTIKRKKCIV